MKSLVLLLATLLMTACSHEIEIYNAKFPDGRSVGDVISASGTRDCRYVFNPCEIVVVGDYIEEYRAVPHGPHTTFAGWKNCPEPNGDICRVDVSESVMRRLYGLKAPLPLAATFLAKERGREYFEIETCRTESGDMTLCDLWMPYGFFYPFQPNHPNYYPNDNPASIGINGPYSQALYYFELDKKYTAELEFGYEEFYSRGDQWARWKFDGGEWEYIFYSGADTVIIGGEG